MINLHRGCRSDSVAVSQPLLQNVNALFRSMFKLISVNNVITSEEQSKHVLFDDLPDVGLVNQTSGYMASLRCDNPAIQNYTSTKLTFLSLSCAYVE